MNPAYHITAFLRPNSNVDAQEIHDLILRALKGFQFQIEFDMEDSDTARWQDLLDDAGKAELADAGLSDLDLLSQDMTLYLDGYSFLIAVSQGHEVSDLAGSLEEDEILPQDRWIFSGCDRCIEIFSEEPDPDGAYSIAMAAITGQMRKDWDAAIWEEKD